MSVKQVSGNGNLRRYVSKTTTLLDSRYDNESFTVYVAKIQNNIERRKVLLNFTHQLMHFYIS